MYRVIDWLKKPCKGTFYQIKLQTVNLKDTIVHKSGHMMMFKGWDKIKKLKLIRRINVRDMILG